MAYSWLRTAFALALVGLLGTVDVSCATTSAKSTVPTYTWTHKTVATGCPVYSATTSLAHIPVTTSSGAKPAFTALVASDGTVASQIVAADKNKNPILFKTSNSSQITLFLASNHRAIIDNHGARLFSNDCRSEFVLPIPNLLADAKKYSSQKTRRSPRRKAKRATSDGTSIPLVLSFFDQCKNPVVKGHTASAQCIAHYDEAGGFKTSTKVALGLSGNSFIGSCAVPNPSADKKRCQDDIKAILDYPTQGWLGQLTNVGSALGFIASVVRAGTIRSAAVAAAGAFEIPEIALGLGALSLYEIAVQAGLDTAISNTVCSTIGHITLEVDAALDSQPQQSIAYEATAPFTGVTVSRTVSLTSVTCSSSTSTSKTTSSSSSSKTSSTSTPSPAPTNILTNGGFGDYYLNGNYYITPWIACDPIYTCRDYAGARQDIFNSSNYNYELVNNYQVPYDYIYQSAPNPLYGSGTDNASFLLSYRYLPYGGNPGDIRSLAAIIGSSTVAAQTFEGYISETAPYTTFSTQFSFPRTEPSVTLTLSLNAPQTTMGGNVFLDDVTIAPVPSATKVARREAVTTPLLS